MKTHLLPAIRLTLVLAALTGLAYPLAVTAVARFVFPAQAGGSLLRDGRDQVVGSALLGQSFAKPGYFHPRPSAAGSGYDASASSGTNLGPTSRKLAEGLPDGTFAGVAQLASAYRRENGLPADATVPADAVTRSASGLDPHISPANARLQAPRVAHDRGLPPEKVERLVEQHVERPQWGFLGDARVNVLRLNLALDRVTGR